MSYWDVSNLSDDPDFRARCTASLATEGHEQPEQQAYAWRWQYAGQPGFGDAYATAVLNEVPNPGRDPGVISDGMILASTQALLGGTPAGDPTAAWPVPRIVDWLATRGVELTPDALDDLNKTELLALVANLLNEARA